jgi:flagellar basal body-associated protein FliL
MAEEEERKEDSNEPKAKSGPNIIIVILVLLAIQAAVAIAVVMFVIPKEGENDLSLIENPENAIQSTTVIADELVLPTKAEVIVNIAGTDGMRFLKARIALAYDKKNTSNKGLESALIGLEAQLKSKISEYLSSLTLAQVNDRNIRRIISSELLSELNSIIPVNAGRLSNVYVEEFIIQ